MSDTEAKPGMMTAANRLISDALENRAPAGIDITTPMSREIESLRAELMWWHSSEENAVDNAACRQV